MSEKESRIRAITRIYYSRPDVQKIILEFSKDREVVPRYYEGFGKRPDSIQYVSDIMGLVGKGATSFHSSQELWNDVFAINSDMSQEDFHKLRRPGNWIVHGCRRPYPTWWH